MKIQGDLQSLQQVAAPAEVSIAAKPPGTQSTVDASSPGAETHLSAAAHLLSQAAALPDVRMEKVASVQAALANGSYEVSSSDVASKLVEHMQQGQE